MTVVDLGGGKRPSIPISMKESLSLYVIGLDISEAELNSAPPQSYDERIVADAADFSFADPADLILSDFVVEHVVDVRSMFANIYNSLKPGGVTIHRIPCRYCAPSLLNSLLPHSVKRKVLFELHPDRRETAGFPAYYNYCSPGAMSRLLADIGFREIQIRSISFGTSYFKVFFPAHVMVSCWSLMTENLGMEQFCTRFVIEAIR
jgi:trans-aconitate methyltransferase